MLPKFLFRSCVILHDLLVDYLQFPPNENQLRQSYQQELHQKLIQSYEKRCQGRWHGISDDGYYYQYLIYHAIQAGYDHILQLLLTDFNWMTSKVKVFRTLHDLRLDVYDCIQYFDSKQQVRNPCF